ncbi:MAG: DUF72 domain-containing protein [Elusimicrobia bacterium]|nr:DUF72 domain-containing protein [Elusimicrobiota bacterium]
MAGLQVGCRGFPVARDRYFRELGAVEVSDTRSRLPRLETARRWRAEAPDGFVFSLVAPAAITHTSEGSPRAADATGHFRDAPPVRRAWEAFEAVIDAVQPRFVVFETPPSFYNHANYIKDMYAFFRAARRGTATFVWARHGGGWEARVLAKVAKDLGLLLASDPLNGAEPEGRMRYLRVAGRVVDKRIVRQTAFSDPELKTILHAGGSGPSVAFLGNSDCWRDAKRLRAMGAA